MLEIRPVYTSYEREEYIKPFGITPDNDCFVVGAMRDGAFIGAGYGKIEGENATIFLMSLYPEKEDDVDRFIMGKAVLNYIDLEGVKNVTYTGNEERLAKALGFKLCNGSWNLNLEGYFAEKH
jgi:hypothetical protein